MRLLTRRRAAGVAAALAVGLAVPPPRPAAAQQSAPAEVAVELNKAEAVEGACRIYLLVQNHGEEAYDALTLELVSFGREGVVGQRLAVELAPVRARKTVVKLFDLPGGGECETTSRLLVNDVSACTVAGQAVPDCLERLRVSARAGIELFK